MRKNRTTPALQSIPLRQALTALLTPATWRQAQQAWHTTPKKRRWELHPLLWVLLLLCW